MQLSFIKNSGKLFIPDLGLQNEMCNKRSKESELAHKRQEIYVYLCEEIA